jgi:hypothetical protein
VLRSGPWFDGELNYTTLQLGTVLVGFSQVRAH